MRSTIAAVVAIALHAGFAAAVVTIDPARFRSEVPIEISVEDKTPPPELKPAPKEPPPPPPERPRVVMKKAPAPMPVAPPPEAPPPPNEEPPKPTDAPPVFGVTMSSVVSGPGPGMAVPVGNTLMTKPGKPANPGDAKPYPAEGTRPFSPVAEMYIAKYPEKLHEVNSDDVYPPEAKRMGIEGVVRFKLGVDEKGDVVDVRIIEKAGHGFDEAAAKALRKFKFKPAVANDGRPVPCRIEYTYRFDLTQ
jgi:protein TonB